MITLPYTNKITADEVLQNIKDNYGKCFSFTLKENWSTANYATLNILIDDIVEDADLFGPEISYIAKSLDQNVITFEVVVNDVSEYLKEYGIQ